MQLPDPKAAVVGVLTSRAPRLYPPFFRAVFGGMDAEQAHHRGFDAIRLAERTGASAALRAAFLGRGGHLVEGAPVDALDLSGGRVAGVTGCGRVVYPICRWTMLDGPDGG